MIHPDLEHTIRAAGSMADAPKLVIMCSQAILGGFPDSPAELTVSAEANTYPLDAPEKAALIDGSIGEKSPFHETFGYYAHGVGPETAEGRRTSLSLQWEQLRADCRPANSAFIMLQAAPTSLAEQPRQRAAEPKKLVQLQHGLLLHQGKTYNVIDNPKVFSNLRLWQTCDLPSMFSKQRRGDSSNSFSSRSISRSAQQNGL